MKLFVLILFLLSSLMSFGSVTPDLSLSADCAKMSSLSYEQGKLLSSGSCQESELPSNNQEHQDDHCFQHCMHHMSGLLSSLNEVHRLTFTYVKLFELRKYISSDYLDSLFRPPIS